MRQHLGDASGKSPLSQRHQKGMSCKQPDQDRLRSARRSAVYDVVGQLLEWPIGTVADQRLCGRAGSWPNGAVSTRP